MEMPFYLPPLTTFSLYSHVQALLLTERARSLAVDLDKAFSAEGVDGGLFNRIYGEFWLWVLGAYECTRTMCQHQHCFSAPTAERFAQFKRSIAMIRMPFAKQELQGREGILVRHELSVSAVDSTRKDFAFDVAGMRYWMREPLESFANMVASLTAQDVLHRMGTPKPPPSAA